MRRISTPENQEILKMLAEAYAKTQGPSEGDFIRLPDVHPRAGKWTRITYVSPDREHAQTGGMNGYFFLGRGGLSYSNGSLDAGLPTEFLLPTQETKEGSCWFFDGLQAGAGRGVTANIPCRVFELAEDAPLEGIEEWKCPHGLTVLDPKKFEPHNEPYRFRVKMRGCCEQSFNEEAGLFAWLAENGLRLTKGLLVPQGERAFYQRLAFV